MTIMMRALGAEAEEGKQKQKKRNEDKSGTRSNSNNSSTNSAGALLFLPFSLLCKRLVLMVPNSAVLATTVGVEDRGTEKKIFL